MHNVMPYKSETNDILTECFDDSIVRSCGGRCTCSEVTAASEQLTENICLEVAAAGGIIAAATRTGCSGLMYNDVQKLRRQEELLRRQTELQQEMLAKKKLEAGKINLWLITVSQLFIELLLSGHLK